MASRRSIQQRKLTPAGSILSALFLEGIALLALFLILMHSPEQHSSRAEFPEAATASPSMAQHPMDSFQVPRITPVETTCHHNLNREVSGRGENSWTTPR